VLDRAWGGVILSTEDLFVALTPHLRPQRILLVGLEPGVWRDWPHNTALWDDLTPARWQTARHGVGGAQGADVTGGMHGKVQRMLALVQAHPGLEVHIFSGQQPGALTQALEGRLVGTRLNARPISASSNRPPARRSARASGPSRRASSPQGSPPPYTRWGRHGHQVLLAALFCGFLGFLGLGLFGLLGLGSLGSLLLGGRGFLLLRGLGRGRGFLRLTAARGNIGHLLKGR